MCGLRQFRNIYQYEKLNRMTKSEEKQRLVAHQRCQVMPCPAVIYYQMVSWKYFCNGNLRY